MQRHERLAVVMGSLLAAIVAYSAVIACSPPRSSSYAAPKVLIPCELPEDFVYLKKQLTSLEISCPPSSLGLSDFILESLSLPGGLVEDWGELPRHLTELRIQGAASTSFDLKYLPPTVEKISLQWSRRLKKVDFPSGLITMNVQGKDLAEAFAPESVRNLSFTHTSISSTEEIPEVESLHIEGVSFLSTAGLPGSLMRLELEGTSVESIEGLPPNLMHLSLTQNDKLSVSRLPSRLISLALHGLGVPIPQLARQVPSLEMLDVQDIHWSFNLPPLVTRLRIAPSDQLTIDQLPNSIEYLELLRYSSVSVSNLPPNLRVLKLRFSVAQEFQELPSKLESLDLTGTNVNPLPDFSKSSGLRELYLGATRRRAMPRLPRTLESLSVKGSSCIEVLDLRGMDKLVSLDVSNSSVSRIVNLPPSLRKLNVGNSQLKNIRYPRGLVSLTLHQGQERKLGDMPSLKNLSFVNEVEIESCE